MLEKQHTNYIPFARKYRPLNFSQLIGQDVLVKTLSYCIENQRLSQTYLLTGIRGIGKTSSARIIAKTVNCTDLKFSNQQAIPCEECLNCKSFNEHNHPDIIELDAASRTSIDDIREIIESSEYRPLIGCYKFFIIDEVHMLSKSAFNALLKIMEEPPQHVIFILATTEVQKIPLTVISRCQRYDLKRFSFEETLNLLKKIIQLESIDIERSVLKIIASRSEGSARDAVSMMDQLASYAYKKEGKKKITLSDITEMLGTVSVSITIKFIKLIIANNPKESVELLHEMYFNSSNLEHFLQEVSQLIAQLCKYKVISNYNNPIYTDYLGEITDILLGVSLSKLTTLWQIFSSAESQIKNVHNELIYIEMLIIKATHACNIPKIEDIINLDTKLVETKSDNCLEKEANFSNSDNTIYDFLKYCHQNNEMEIYYFLLNEVEVVHFENGQFDIKLKNATKFGSKIETLLESWSGQTWNVNYSKEKDIKSIKDSMLEKAHKSEEYNLIKNYFPDANISDILLKK